MELFFSHNGKNQQGPFDVDGLKLKEIDKDTPIWSEGKSRWITAGKVKELQYLFNDSEIATMPNDKVAQNRTILIQERGNSRLSFLRVICIGIVIVIVSGTVFYFCSK